MIQKIHTCFNRLTQSIFVGLTLSIAVGVAPSVNAAEKVVFSMNSQTISLQTHLEKIKQEEAIDFNVDLNSLSNTELEGDYKIEVSDLDRLVREEETSTELQNYFEKVKRWQNYLETEINQQIKNEKQEKLDADIRGIDAQIQSINNNPFFTQETKEKRIQTLEERKETKRENMKKETQKLRDAIQKELQEKLGNPAEKLKEELNRSISGSQNNSEREDDTFLSQLMNVSDLERKEFRNLMTQFKGVNVLKFLQDFPEVLITRDNFLNCLKTCDFDNKNHEVEKKDDDENPPRKTGKNNKQLNVLWYGQSSLYNKKMSEIAQLASTYDPWGDGSLDWNLNFWNPLDAAPTFSDYDVFVIGSAFRIPPHGFNFNSAGLFSYKKEIEKARGERTILTGLDADSHYMLPHAGQNRNLPKNFLINTVNWAGSGEGLGIVSLTDGNRTGSRWWLNENSFLKEELEGYLTYSNRNDIGILDEMLDFPIHEGLTAANLSNWRNSNHVQFADYLPDYCSVNHLANNPEKSTTVMSGNCNKSIPEPSVTLGLLTLGLMSFGSFVKRQKA